MSSKKVEIFLIYYGLLNSRGGSNTHVLELLKNLNKYANITLFVMKSDAKFGISDVKNVPYLNNKYCIGLSYELFLFFYLLYYCIKNKPDVVYLRQDTISFFPIILCNVFNIRSVVEINGLIRDELLMSYSSKPLILKVACYLSTTSERFTYKHCDKIISVTQKLKAQLIKIYDITDDKIVVINNGANTDLFKTLPKKKVLSELNLDFSNTYICFVGKLSPWQGVEFLIEAAPLILKVYANTRFLIVGDGIMKKEWVQLAEDLGVLDKFIFTGGVPYEMVPIYINASDICVVPKKPMKSGYSPLKLYEYMACGKPIIATRTNGFEFLEEENAGILINSENPVEFSNSILMLLGNPELMTNMGNNGRKYVVANHSWDNVARMVLDVCNDVIKDR